MDYTMIRMIAFDNKTISGIIGSIGIAGVYGFSFWRIFKNNHGNKSMECAVITLILFFVLIALVNIPNFPDWILIALSVLVVPLCLLTLFFFGQRAYRAIRHRKNGLPNQREAQDREGYLKRPQSPAESRLWEAETSWPEEWRR